MSQNLSDVRKFFSDPDASDAIVVAAQQIAAPLVQGAPLTVEESMMGAPRVVYFLFDASYSMDPVAEMLREGMNTEFVYAAKEAREDDVSVLRLGGASFGSESRAFVPMWQGQDGSYFHPLDTLPNLSTSDYKPHRDSATALHNAILKGSATALRYASELRAQSGSAVDVDIIVLSDGANNCPPDAAEVKRIVAGSDRARVRYSALFFETPWGLKVQRTPSGSSQVEDYFVNDLGFDPENVHAFTMQDGEDEKARRSRFRRLLRVMSRVSATRGQSVVMAVSALDDDELV